MTLKKINLIIILETQTFLTFPELEVQSMVITFLVSKQLNSGMICQRKRGRSLHSIHLKFLLEIGMESAANAACANDGPQCLILGVFSFCFRDKHCLSFYFALQNSACLPFGLRWPLRFIYIDTIADTLLKKF